MTIRWIAFLSLPIALCPGGANASITINPSSIAAYADDHVGSSSSAGGLLGTVIPASNTWSAIDGTSYSTNSIDWSAGGGQIVLSFDISHQRSGTQFAYGQTGVYLAFTANVNTTYALSGYYNVTDVGANESGDVRQYVFFSDVTANVPVFISDQISQSTHEEQFTLGVSGGDIGNGLFGSLTGNLIAGHNYEMYSGSYINAFPDGDSGASAVGNLTLTIGQSSVTPEPLSALVWSCLISSVAGVNYKIRRARRGSNR